MGLLMSLTKQATLCFVVPILVMLLLILLGSLLMQSGSNYVVYPEDSINSTNINNDSAIQKTNRQNLSETAPILHKANTTHEVLIWSGGVNNDSTRVYAISNPDGSIVYHNLYRLENICILGPTWRLIVDDSSAKQHWQSTCFNNSNCETLCTIFNCAWMYELMYETVEETAHRSFFSNQSMIINTNARDQHPEHFSTPNIWLYGLLSEADYYNIGPPSALVYAYQLSSYPVNALEFVWGVVRDTFGLKEFMWFEDMFLEYKPFCFRNAYVANERIIQGKPEQVLAFRRELLRRMCLLPLDHPPRSCVKQRRAVYVMRCEGNYGLRRIKNWPELELHALTKYNVSFQHTCLSSQMPFDEQAALFNNADLLISTHGGQLFNMLFTRFNTSIIEVVPKLYSLAYAARAPTFGIHYQICEGGVPDWTDCSERFVLAESQLKTGILCNLTLSVERFDQCLLGSLAALGWH